MIRSYPCYLLFRTVSHVDTLVFSRSRLPFTQLQLVLPILYGHSPVISRGYPPQVPSIVSWVQNTIKAMARATPLPASEWFIPSFRIMPQFITFGIFVPGSSNRRSGSAVGSRRRRSFSVVSMAWPSGNDLGSGAIASLGSGPPLPYWLHRVWSPRHKPTIIGAG